MEVSGGLKNMTPSSPTTLTFSRILFVDSTSRRSTASLNPRRTISDLDGSVKDQCQRAYFQNALYSPTHMVSLAIVTSSNQPNVKMLFQGKHFSATVRKGKHNWIKKIPCCIPVADQIKFPMARRYVEEPYANDTTLNVSWKLYHAITQKNVSLKGVESVAVVQF